MPVQSDWLQPGKGDQVRRGMVGHPKVYETMTPGLNLYKTAPEAMKAAVELEDTVRQSELDLSLIDLVETRVSQINGCVYCIHMHTSEPHLRRDRGAPLSARRMA